MAESTICLLLVGFLFSYIAFAQDFDAGKAERARAAYERRMLEQLASQPYSPHPDSSLEYLGRWGWGMCGGVAVMGDYVLTGSGPTLLWLDVSDKCNPRIAWEMLTDGPLRNFIIRDSIGYALLSSQSLLIIDLRNPTLPVVRAQLPINSALLGLTITGSFAFVKRYSGFLYCIDISNPAAPYLRATIRETSAQWGNLASSGHSVYIGDQNGFTEHVDVSNPDNARVTILYNVAFTVTALHAKDTLLLLGNGGSRLYIYSIRTPVSPVQLSNANIGVTGIVSITSRGDTAFIGTMDGHVVAIGMADKRNPVVLGTYVPPIFQPDVIASGLAAQDTVVYCSFGNGLTTLSAAVPSSMNILSFLPTGYLSQKVVIRNGLAYVSSGYAGLWVVNISDPLHPQRIRNLPTTGYAFDLVIDSTIAYVSLNHPDYLRNDDAWNGIWSLDISRPESPSRLLKNS